MSIQAEVKRESYQAMKESGKLTGQKLKVYNCLLLHTSPLTAYEIETALALSGDTMLLTSIRRALTDLHTEGCITAVDAVKEKYGVKNTRYKVKAEDLF